MVILSQEEKDLIKAIETTGFDILEFTDGNSLDDAFFDSVVSGELFAEYIDLIGFEEAIESIKTYKTNIQIRLLAKFCFNNEEYLTELKSIDSNLAAGVEDYISAKINANSSYYRYH